MEINKNTSRADIIANLYRAALYLARGNKKLGVEFLRKAKRRKLVKLKRLKTRQQQLFWAEKILDLYQRQRSKLQSSL